MRYVSRVVFVAASCCGCHALPPAPAQPTAALEPRTAPSAAPVEGRAWPVLFEPLRSVMEAAWRLGITRLEVSDGAAYIEREQRGLLCLFGPRAPTCFRWPDGLAAPSDLDESSAQTEVEAPSGMLTISESEQSHELTLLPQEDALLLVHVRSIKRRSESDGFEYTKPKQRASSRSPLGTALWTHGQPKLVRVNELERNLASWLVQLSGSTRSAESGQYKVHTLRHEKYSLWNMQHWRSPGELSEGWVCHREDSERPRCFEAVLDDALIIRPSETLPQGWFVLGDEPMFRDGKTRLAWIDLTAEPPTWAPLTVGKVSGLGQGCGFANSYCVWLRGLYTPYVILTPRCVRLAESITWSAVHVRTQARWVKREQHAATEDEAPRPGTYSPAGSAWVHSPCGSGDVSRGRSRGKDDTGKQ